MPLQPRRRRCEVPVDISRQDKIGSLIYIDDRALTRDCVAGQLLVWLPEFSIAAVASLSEMGESPWGNGARLILYNMHSRCAEDIDFLRNLPHMLSAEPELRVAVVSDLDSRDNIIAALRYGVSGYLLTSMSLKVVFGVLRLVHAGGTYVPSSAVLEPETPAPSERSAMSLPEELGGFTPRQVEVLSRLRDGKQNKTIAFELNMSESTVKVHLHHIMQKLHATNRMQVILRTRQLFEERHPVAGPEAATDVHCTSKGTAAAVWPMDLAPPVGEATF